MADLHIHREHGLGLAGARKVALEWAEHVEQEFDMECTIEEGDAADTVHFKRSGVNGTLEVSDDAFELRAKLGFLLGAFKGRIEAEIVKNLDTLLASKPARKKASSKK
ncbi:MAG: polyhydroxyalkanoic acid synthase [Rhodoferax sp.]|nr:MAG: polyhydroxyalkanoic acid synthase [Rhodoferax sp.]